MPNLTDPFGRNIEYLRLSVTDRCDFRCFYCIPKGFKDFTPPDTWLTSGEVIRVVRLFAEMGVSKVRVTGGEPLVRKDLPELTKSLGALPGIEDLSLSTNASQLAKHAKTLRDAGVSRINVSLDSLDPEKFQEITHGDLEKVIQGLMAAKAAGMHPIKINMVVMKGVNDQEVGAMVDFCREHNFTLRFIETMPVGETGKNATDRYVSLKSIKQELASQYKMVPAVMRGGGPASYVRLQETDMRIGFITPMSQHFCETCNRVRLSVEGTLFLCLGKHDNLELRPLLRSGASDEVIKDEIRAAIARKPMKHEFKEKPGEVVRIMSLTGG